MNRILDPATSRHCDNGISTRFFSIDFPSHPANRTRSSTSNTHVVRNGVSKRDRVVGVFRKSFAPHYVSYISMSKRIETAVANARPE